jgi:phospholipid/cholesterol/gamma-HCH transport system substrate-binding protein
MKNNRHAITVGLFIFIGLVILTLGVLTVGIKKDFLVKSIKVHVIFNDVNGLKNGNNIWLSGVKIGTVSNILLVDSQNVDVTLKIEKSQLSHVHNDIKAKISSEGYLGNKLVVLYGGTESAPLLKNGDYVQTEKQKGNEDLMATLQQNSNNLLAITGDFKKISSKIASGEGTLGGIIYDSTLIKNLRATLQNFNTASANSQKAVDNINAFAYRLNHQQGFINQMIQDTSLYAGMQKFVDTLKETSSRLRRAAANANDFTDTLKKAGSQLNKTNNPVGALLNDEKAATDLKETIHNLNTSTQKLDATMEGLQHNFFFRLLFGGKKKKQ